MEYIDHDHHYSLPRGGKVLTGDDSFNGENFTVDTPEYDRRQLPTSFKSSGKIGVIQPCLSLHVNSGDVMSFDANLFQRFQPVVATPMTSIESSIHSFYVPYRMVDYGFEQFFTGGTDGNYKRPCLTINFDSILQQGWDPSVIAYPFFASGTMGSAVYPTYFGKPLGGIGSLLEDFKFGYQVTEYTSINTPKISCALDSKCNVSLLVAYHRIYNDYYRVPEIETDLFIHNPAGGIDYYYNSLYALAIDQSLSVEGETTACKILDVRKILEQWQFSEFAKGFLGYMLHLLTDPLMQEVRFAAYSSSSSNYVQGAQNDSDHSLLYDNEMNSISLLGLSGIVTPASSGTSSSTIIVVDMGEFGKMSKLDLLCFVFSILLASCKNAPYERDRFTSVLPYLQRGELAKMINDIKVDSLGGTLPALWFTSKPDSLFENGDISTGEDSLFVRRSSDPNTSLKPLYTSITIDDIRTLNSCAKFLEKNARLGYHFDEYVNGMFGIDVKTPDHLSQPTYFGGLKTYSNIDIITSPSQVGDSNAAQQYSNITSGDSSHIGNLNVPEPGIVLSLLITKPRLSYINTPDRNNYKYADRTLLYNPDFAHLQEQPVWISEVNSALNYTSSVQTKLGDLINGDIGSYDSSELAASFFGYEPRYSEYKNIPSLVGGELATSQIYNSMARQLVTATDDYYLQNDYFFQHVLYNDPSVLRIFNFNDDVVDQFLFSVGWSIDCKSLVPNNSNPRL